MEEVRVRFAPSPTGPLHIGGVRTALYNYLFAKKHNGKFLLRIEDTDQKRYVPGAEDYIINTLKWLELNIDEGPQIGGEYGPYRQSERKDLYEKYAKQLVDEEKAYYAFDTPEELEAMRKSYEAKGVHSQKYNYETRKEMSNSLSMDATELAEALNSSSNVHIRLKVEPNHTIEFEDMVRGQVSFESNELDDKVLLKADGMPTYHMANIVDDHLMKISHVIRGEEWLSSTAHHVLLYRAFGWEDIMPKFAHLPLILKPNGKGKLSKRDGAKFGFPVFPMDWNDPNSDDFYDGFKEFGFDPKAVINFLAFLGWNPGGTEEIYDLKALTEAFDPSNIVKSGARFDIDKAYWYNQQYILSDDEDRLSQAVGEIFKSENSPIETDKLNALVRLMKQRVKTYNDFYSETKYLFGDLEEMDEKSLSKKWKEDSANILLKLIEEYKAAGTFEAQHLESLTKSFVETNSLGFGQVFPLLRLALSGSLKGPDLFEMMAFLGKSTVVDRLEELINRQS